MRPLDRRIIMYKLAPLDHQEVYFSYVEYGDPYPVFPDTKKIELSSSNYFIVLTGIEDPSPLHHYIQEKGGTMEAIQRKDHHPFGDRDLRQLKKAMEHASGKDPVVLTTEKDASRIKGSRMADEFAKLPLHAIPMKVAIHGDEEAEMLEQRSIKHVREDQRNDRIHQE